MNLRKRSNLSRFIYISEFLGDTHQIGLLMQKIQHRAVISTLYNYASVFANTIVPF